MNAFQELSFTNNLSDFRASRSSEHFATNGENNDRETGKCKIFWRRT